jgi:hypothetical protein
MGWAAKELWFNSREGFSKAPRPSLGLTQPHIQWVLGAHSPAVEWLGCEASCLHLALKLKMRRARL